MEQNEAGTSYWESFYRPHPVIFALLVFLGLDLEFVVHYYYGITIVYTQLFYLIIVIAGLWYGRKAVWVALLFGILHVSVTFIVTGLLSPDALMRAVVMLIVAFVVGTIVEQKQGYCDQVVEQNHDLTRADARMHALNPQLAENEETLPGDQKK